MLTGQLQRREPAPLIETGHLVSGPVTVFRCGYNINVEGCQVNSRSVIFLRDKLSSST